MDGVQLDRLVCAKPDCVGRLVLKEDAIGKYTECDRCGIQTLVPGEGSPMQQFSAPDPPRFALDKRSLPSLPANVLRKMKVRGVVRKTQVDDKETTQKKERMALEKQERGGREAQKADAERRWRQMETDTLAVATARIAALGVAIEELTETIALWEGTIGDTRKVVAALGESLKEQGIDLEDLQAKASAKRPYSSRTYPVCSVCGKQFTTSSQYSGGQKYGTPPVCRSGCPGANSA